MEDLISMRKTCGSTGLMILNAIHSRLKADKEAAEANLEIILDRAVGTGECSDIVAEASKYVEQIANTMDQLAVLSQYLITTRKE